MCFLTLRCCSMTTGMHEGKGERMGESERCNTENKHKGRVITPRASSCEEPAWDMNVKLQRQKAERAENPIPEDQHQMVNEENDRIGGGTGGEV